MNKNKFGFEDALLFMQSDMTVGLNLNGKERHYFIKDGEIYCIPNNKEHLLYKVKEFYIDSILSNNWFLVDEEA